MMVNGQYSSLSLKELSRYWIVDLFTKKSDSIPLKFFC